MALDFSNILNFEKKEKAFVPFSKRKKKIKVKKKVGKKQKPKAIVEVKKFPGIWGKEKEASDIEIFYSEILSVVENGAWFLASNENSLPVNVFIEKTDISFIGERSVYVSELFAKARGLA